MNDLNSAEQADTNNEQAVVTSWNIQDNNQNIEEVQEKANLQKSKEEVQAEIMSYFIQNPENNITLGMNISKEAETWYEVIDFWDAKHEDEKLNNVFSAYGTQRIWWVKLISNETLEKWEEFSKELVIDRKTDKKGILLVGKKGFNIEQVDFEDVTKYDVPYETYFVYKEDWQTYIRLIKNKEVIYQFKTRDSDLSWKMNIEIDDLKNINPDMLQQVQEQLQTTLKAAKNSWTLDMTIDMLLSQMPLAKEMLWQMRAELYNMANS